MMRLGMPLVLFAALAAPVWCVAAELRGTVTLKEAGFPGRRGAVPEGFAISVALLSADGQRFSSRAPREHRLDVVGNRFSPRYLVIRRGDSVRFRNRDDLHHHIFSEAREAPIRFELDPDVSRREQVRRFERAGVWHLFCRIHGRSYARIDVLEASWVQMVKPGGRFEFRDLAPGTWRLRLAAPGVETRIVTAEAMTAPPPLNLVLEAHATTAVGGNVTLGQIGIEQLYPVQPGN